MCVCVCVCVCVCMCVFRVGERVCAGADVHVCGILLVIVCIFKLGLYCRMGLGRTGLLDCMCKCFRQ